MVIRSSQRGYFLWRSACVKYFPISSHCCSIGWCDWLCSICTGTQQVCIAAQSCRGSENILHLLYSYLRRGLLKVPLPVSSKSDEDSFQSAHKFLICCSVFWFNVSNLKKITSLWKSCGREPECPETTYACTWRARRLLWQRGDRANRCAARSGCPRMSTTH